MHDILGKPVRLQVQGKTRGGVSADIRLLVSDLVSIQIEFVVMDQVMDQVRAQVWQQVHEDLS